MQGSGYVKDNLSEIILNNVIQVTEGGVSKAVGIVQGTVMHESHISCECQKLYIRQSCDQS